MEYSGKNHDVFNTNKSFSFKRTTYSSRKYSLNNTEKQRIRIFAKRSVHMDESSKQSLKRILSEDASAEATETEVQPKKIKIENVN